MFNLLRKSDEHAIYARGYRCGAASADVFDPGLTATLSHPKLGAYSRAWVEGWFMGYTYGRAPRN